MSAVVEIKKITYQQALPLRAKVLKPFLKLEECVNPGDLRSDTFHLGAYLNSDLIGIASYEVEGHPHLPAQNAFRLRGMASDPDYRRHGVGRALVLGGLEEIVVRKGDLLWFNARILAFPFYESLGFEYWGDLFTLPRIGEHKVMYKYLRAL